jgi:DoxX-like protein
MTYALWFVQIVLALLFLFAGGLKLVVPVEALGLPFVLPVVFVRFIGVCELLGALGLILPGALRIRTHLTPVAALGLTTIMVGATMFTPPDQIQLAVVPVGVGLLTACVAYGRWRVAPLRTSSQLRASAPAR